MSRDNIKHLWDYEEQAVLSFLPEEITKGRLDLPTAGGKGVIGREIALRLAKKKKSPFVSVFFYSETDIEQAVGKVVQCSS